MLLIIAVSVHIDPAEDAQKKLHAGCDSVPKTSTKLCHVTVSFANIGAVPAHTQRLPTFAQLPLQ
jgi:hypothetical protein